MKKIIPCLDMKDGNVVKGINFVNIKSVGNPVEIAKKYCEEGADELVFLDIAATVEERKTRCDLVKEVASVVNIPFTVGGGIKSIEDIEEVLNAGADKVGINSAAIKDKKFLENSINKFGAEKIVLALDGKRTDNGSWNVVVNGGMVDTGMDAIEWAKEAKRLGVKEILLTSLDEDGEKNGYDINFTKAVKQIGDVVVTASGGCGRLEDFYNVLKEDVADNALAASVFHYDEIKIPELKQYLAEKGIEVNK
ncbi:MAG: imidazole glycerol phosphate synthase subunit HisF [Sarcina sp.]